MAPNAPDPASPSPASRRPAAARPPTPPRPPADPLTPLLKLIAAGKLSPEVAARKLLQLPPADTADTVAPPRRTAPDDSPAIQLPPGRHEVVAQSPRKLATAPSRRPHKPSLGGAVVARDASHAKRSAGISAGKSAGTQAKRRTRPRASRRNRGGVNRGPWFAVGSAAALLGCVTLLVRAHRSAPDSTPSPPAAPATVALPAAAISQAAVAETVGSEDAVVGSAAPTAALPVPPAAVAVDQPAAGHQREGHQLDGNQPDGGLVETMFRAADSPPTATLLSPPSSDLPSSNLPSSDLPSPTSPHRDRSQAAFESPLDRLSAAPPDRLPAATPEPSPEPPSVSLPSAASDIPPAIRHDCTAANQRFEWDLPSRDPSIDGHLSLLVPPSIQLDMQWVQPLDNDPSRSGERSSGRSAAGRRQQAILQWTLPSAPHPAIRCQIEVRQGSRLQLRLRYTAQLAADQPWQPFTTTELARSQDQLVQRMTHHSSLLAQLQQQYRLATRSQRTSLRPQREALEQSVEQLQASLQLLQQLAILHATIQDQSPLSVRLAAGPSSAAEVWFATAPPAAPP